MKFTSETPTGSFVIQGVTFSIVKPFAEGHVCSASEAGVLNQTLAENVRNNLSTRVKAVQDKAKEEGKPFDQKAMQAEIEKYIEEYDFGVRRGRGPVDPVDREALIIATEEVKNALRENGFKIAEFDTAQIRSLAEDTIEQNPAIMKLAKTRVKQREDMGGITLDIKKKLKENQPTAG